MTKGQLAKTAPGKMSRNRDRHRVPRHPAGDDRLGKDTSLWGWVSRPPNCRTAKGASLDERRLGPKLRRFRRSRAVLRSATYGFANASYRSGTLISTISMIVTQRSPNRPAPIVSICHALSSS